MTGVTHFEKRGRPKKRNPACPFCGKFCLITTRRVASVGRAEFVEAWARHLSFCTKRPEFGWLSMALVHMADVGAAVERAL